LTGRETGALGSEESVVVSDFTAADGFGHQKNVHLRDGASKTSI
jgi:hypothetical protein